MADSAALLAVRKFAELVAAECPTVAEALHFEPEELGSLPAVTCLHKRVGQEDVQTGPSTMNTYTWVVSITVGIGGHLVTSDFEHGQDDLLNCLPEVLAVVRHHPDLDDTCDRASIADLGEEPEVEVDEEGSPTGILVKTLELAVVLEEV